MVEEGNERLTCKCIISATLSIVLYYHRRAGWSVGEDKEGMLEKYRNFYLHTYLGKTLAIHGIFHYKPSSIYVYVRVPTGTRHPNICMYIYGGADELPISILSFHVEWISLHYIRPHTILL